MSADRTRAERVERLNRSFRVILGDYEQAERWNDPRRIDAYRTALVVLDACAAAEEGLFAITYYRDNIERAEVDGELMDRLREIARMRNVLPVKGEPVAESTE